MHIYYLMVSVSQKSSCSLAGCSGSLVKLSVKVVSWGWNPLEVALGEDGLPSAPLWLQSSLDVGWSPQFLLRRKFLRTVQGVCWLLTESSKQRESKMEATGNL